MINLTTLSALVRTLRLTSGVDAPAAAVARILSVPPVTDDDPGAMLSTASRAEPWARTRGSQLDTAPLAAVARGVRTMDDAPVVAPKGAPATEAGRVPGPAMVESASVSLDFTEGALLLQTALRGTELKSPAAPTITSAAPLVRDARASPLEFAQGLQAAVADSGLFYESHLARALGGDYPPAALAREPQASWSAAPQLGGIMANVTGAALTAEASALLGRQLDLLDTRSLAWNGVLWPGQRATIEFEEERPGHGAATGSARETPALSNWRTRIVLDLPSLGRVHATLDWRGSALNLDFAAATPEAQLRLQSAKSLLASSLSGADVLLGRFAVAVDATT